MPDIQAQTLQLATALKAAFPELTFAKDPNSGEVTITTAALRITVAPATTAGPLAESGLRRLAAAVLLPFSLLGCSERVDRQNAVAGAQGGRQYPADSVAAWFNVLTPTEVQKTYTLIHQTGDGVLADLPASHATPEQEKVELLYLAKSNPETFYVKGDSLYYTPEPTRVSAEDTLRPHAGRVDVERHTVGGVPETHLVRRQNPVPVLGVK